MSQLLDKVNARYIELTNFTAAINSLYEHDLQKDTEALDYLMNQRGFSQATIKRYKIGLATNYTRLLTFIRHNKLSEEYLQDTGILTVEDTSLVYRMADRITFPATDLVGNIVGYAGRIFKSDDSRVKYKNLATTEIYRKSLVLYGLDYALDTIIARNFVIIVEGHLDVITMQEAGLLNVVAGGGTALAQEHLLLLRCFTNRIVTLYDADAAGRKASERAISLCADLGLQHTDVSLPAGEDPDSFVRAYGNQPILTTLKTQWDMLNAAKG